MRTFDTAAVCAQRSLARSRAFARKCGGVLVCAGVCVRERVRAFEAMEWRGALVQCRLRQKPFEIRLESLRRALKHGNRARDGLEDNLMSRQKRASTRGRPVSDREWKDCMPCTTLHMNSVKHWNSRAVIVEVTGMS
eukprot:6208716-Pleurochrysis_carterae.AAC.1